MIIFATIQVTKTPIKHVIFYTRENSEVLWQSWIISMLGKFLLGPRTSASSSSAHIWYEWHGTAMIMSVDGPIHALYKRISFHYFK